MFITHIVSEDRGSNVIICLHVATTACTVIREADVVANENVSNWIRIEDSDGAVVAE